MAFPWELNLERTCRDEKPPFHERDVSGVSSFRTTSPAGYHRAEANALRARRNRAFKQLLKCNVEVVGQPPQIGQQVRA